MLRGDDSTRGWRGSWRRAAEANPQAYTIVTGVWFAIFAVTMTGNPLSGLAALPLMPLTYVVTKRRSDRRQSKHREDGHEPTD
jgi:hypothetical protein